MRKIETHEALMDLIAREKRAREIGVGLADRGEGDKDAPIVFPIVGYPGADDIGWLLPCDLRAAIECFDDGIDWYEANFRSSYLGQSFIATQCYMADSADGCSCYDPEKGIPDHIEGRLEGWFAHSGQQKNELFIKMMGDPEKDRSRAQRFLQQMIMGLGWPDFTPEDTYKKSLSERKAELIDAGSGTWVPGLFQVDTEAAVYVREMSSKDESKASRLSSVNLGRGVVNYAKYNGLIAAACLMSGPSGTRLCESVDDIMDMQYGSVMCLWACSVDPEIPKRRVPAGGEFRRQHNGKDVPGQYDTASHPRKHGTPTVVGD
jgi:hypothetical protein